MSKLESCFRDSVLCIRGTSFVCFCGRYFRGVFWVNVKQKACLLLYREQAEVSERGEMEEAKLLEVRNKGTMWFGFGITCSSAYKG